jgi:hypothetical protein
MAKSESVIYNGITFRRYPESENWADRNYYRPNSTHIRNGVKAIHIEIYQAHYGPVPKGYHVDHKNGDTGNNSKENLQALSPREHSDKHLSPERSQRAREHAERIRPLTKEWHASPAGIEWHRQHALNANFGHFTFGTRNCEQCTKPFEAKTNTARFCSNNCKTKWRRLAGFDDEERECAMCDTKFIVNKYSKTRTCSTLCAGNAISRAKTSVRPNC